MILVQVLLRSADGAPNTFGVMRTISFFPLLPQLAQDMKQGQACANYILGFIGPLGDAALVQAAKNGHISKVKTVDYKSTWYAVYAQRCVVAHGKD